MDVKSGNRGDAENGIGGRIKLAAERAGVAIKVLARTVDVPERTFARYVSGETDPPASVIGRVASATGATPQWLILDEGEPPAKDAARGALMEVMAIAEKALAATTPSAGADAIQDADEIDPPEGGEGLGGGEPPAA